MYLCAESSYILQTPTFFIPCKEIPCQTYRSTNNLFFQASFFPSLSQHVFIQRRPRKPDMAIINFATMISVYNNILKTLALSNSIILFSTSKDICFYFSQNSQGFFVLITCFAKPFLS